MQKTYVENKIVKIYDDKAFIENKYGSFLIDTTCISNLHNSISKDTIARISLYDSTRNKETVEKLDNDFKLNKFHEFLGHHGGLFFFVMLLFIITLTIGVMLLIYHVIARIQYLFFE